MTTDSGPSPRPQVGMYSLFSPDPRRLGRFWSELMGLPVAPGAGDDLVMLDLDHEVSPVTWIIERTDAAAAVEAPFALDIANPGGAEHGELAARAEALGATRVADRDEDGARWIEMRDPDGNRFRVFGPRPTEPPAR